MKCNGSRINAVQSGMMSGINKVYLVELGQKALMKQIVNIFDFAEIEDFPNTNQQKFERGVPEIFVTNVGKGKSEDI